MDLYIHPYSVFLFAKAFVCQLQLCSKTRPIWHKNHDPGNPDYNFVFVGGWVCGCVRNSESETESELLFSFFTVWSFIFFSSSSIESLNKL